MALTKVPNNMLKNTGHFDSDVLITVGAGGDYSTIGEAMSFASQFYPLYTANSISIEVKLLTGFIVSEQVFVENIDLSYVKLTSVDAEVTVDRSALTKISASYYPLFMCDYGSLFRIEALFSMDTSGTATDRIGLQLKNLANGFVDTGCGIKNSPARGAHLISSQLNGNGSVWDGSGIGLRAGNESEAWVRNGSFQNCTTSIMNVAGSSIVAAQDLTATGSVQGIVAENSAVVVCDNLTLNNSAGIVISADSNASVTARGLTATGCLVPRTVRATNGADVDISPNDEGTSSDVSGNTGGEAIYASDLASINAQSADASGANTYGIYAARGSTVNANGVDVSGAGTDGIEVFRGGYVNAHGITGSFSQTANTLSTDGYILN